MIVRLIEPIALTLVPEKKFDLLVVQSVVLLRDRRPVVPKVVRIHRLVDASEVGPVLKHPSDRTLAEWLVWFRVVVVEIANEQVRLRVVREWVDVDPRCNVRSGTEERPALTTISSPLQTISLGVQREPACLGVDISDATPLNRAV